MATSVKLLALTALFLCINIAAGLRCMSCSSPTCSEQYPVNCSSWETRCYSKVMEDSYSYGNMTYTHTWINKGCASHQWCTEESHYASYQSGTESKLTNTTCCDTDDCNVANFSVSPPAGSKQCYGCNPWTYECTANVTCNAMETCFKSDDSHQSYYGCVSENLCNDTNLSRRYIGSYGSISCCNTSHCNAPGTGLQCMACTDSSCSSQRSVTCSTSMCYANAYAISGSYNHSDIRKGCAPPYAFCPAAGSHFISHHFGNEIFLLNTTCCNSNNCNTADPVTVAPPAGSLQCYSCDRYSDECTHVTCNALETCSQTTLEYSRLYGCVSENLCNNASFSQHFFGYHQEISCCNTTDCNVPPFITAPPNTTPNKHPCDDKDDDSVFSTAWHVLPLGLPFSLLGLYTHIL